MEDVMEVVRIGEYVSNDTAKLVNEGKIKCENPKIKVRAVQFRGGLWKIEEKNKKD